MTAAEPADETRRPRARWGQKDARFEDIRDAALTVLRRDGLSGMTMRAVAKEAGVAPGTVYSYFASKDALYAALYADRVEKLGSDLGRACASATTTEQVFITLADLYFEVYETFGRELDVWSLLAGVDESATDATVDATTIRLITAAVTAFAAALDQVERVEPELAAALRDEDQVGIQLLWLTVSGLAEHFSSSRRLLHANPRERLTEVGVRVLVAGLRSELLGRT